MRRCIHIIFYGLLIITISLAFGCAYAVSSDQPHPKWIQDSEWRSLKPEQRTSAWRVDIETYVQEYLSAKHYRLGQGAEYNIRSAIERAARDINDAPVDQQSSKLEEAKRNFTTLINEMIRASIEIPGYAEGNYHTIGEETLMAAFKKLCPIWPFCKERR